MGRRFHWLLLFAAMTLLAGCAPLQDLLAPTPTAAPAGVRIDPPKQMPDFTLANTDGMSTKLSDLRGKAVLVFFGYTHCPDICPLSLSDFRLVKRELGSDADKINFVFISVDGTRDTPQFLGPYVKAFDPGFIGLTGPEEEVRQIGLNYGVHFEKQKPTGTAAAYLVAHTTYSYLLDAQGRWRMVFPYKTPIDSITADVKKLLDETP